MFPLPHGMTVWAIEYVYVFPAPSCRLPLSVIENLVTVTGTFKVTVTVVDAPMPSGP